MKSPSPIRSLCSPIVLMLAVVACVCTPCWARTIRVDADSTATAADGSSRKPFPTISAALDVVEPGDTVEIKGGVYRERIRIPSGAPGRPVVIRAADGERVIVSGAVPVSGWKPAEDGLFTAMLDFRPDRLLIGGRPATMAREPNESWFRSQSVEGTTLVDTENLSHVGRAGEGGQVYVWLQRGNVYATVPIAALDPEQGRVGLAPEKSLHLTDGDKYWLENRVEWIDRPGEWAVEPEEDRFRVTLLPADPSELAAVEAPFFDRAIVTIRDGSDVRLEGIEVCAGRHFGIEVHGVDRVTVARCIAHDNGRNGISLRSARDSSMRNCIAMRNHCGVSVSYSERVTVEGNEIARNGMDGLTVTWQSSDIQVRRNYIHEHQLWGHPDNMQVYRGVERVAFVDNLLIAAGQSLMMEETTDGRFEGNMAIGSAANMFILGHENSLRWRITGNTLAFSGYGCMSLSARDYDVFENVFMTGHAGPVYGVRGVEGYRADRNLFWNSVRAADPMIMPTDAAWKAPFAAVQEATGQDAGSVYADPKFNNAPIALGVLDTSRLEESTPSVWPLRRGAAAFQVGDHVEVNFDGVVRRVTAVGDDTITVAPPLAKKPLKGWLVANWGDRSDFRLDLRLAEDSPGRTMAQGGGPIGSTIDIESYKQGDFDGDGLRDLPSLPEELQDVEAKY